MTLSPTRQGGDLGGLSGSSGHLLRTYHFAVCAPGSSYKLYGEDLTFDHLATFD